MLDASFCETSLSSYTASGTSLVVHFTDSTLDLYLLRYCTALPVDRVIAIETAGLTIIHPHLASHFSDIITLSDTKQLWLKQLIDLHHFSQPITQLSVALKVQQLWKDGEMIKTWHQPLDNHWRHFAQNKEALKQFKQQFGMPGIRWLNSQSFDHETWWTVHGRTHHINDESNVYREFLKLHALVPNRDLENTLNNL